MLNDLRRTGPDQLQPGDTLAFAADITEASGLLPGTGPGFVMGTQVTVRAPGGRTIYARDPDGDGVYTASVTRTWPTGSYSVATFELQDEAGNFSSYWSDGSGRSGNSSNPNLTHTIDFAAANFTVMNEVPGTPTSVAAQAGDRSATVSWTAAPTNCRPVTGYTVTAIPGGATASTTGGATTATFSGLVNGRTYTFTVTATNVLGTGPASAASSGVTPRGSAQNPAPQNPAPVSPPEPGDPTGAPGTRFYLNDDTTGRANVTLAFGDPGDEVLVADGNGDGQDSLMIRRGNQFFVRDGLTSGPAERTFFYGDPGDVVLVGDWNGDGTDTLVVRRGNTFYVKNTTTSGVADSVFTYGDPGDVVLVGDWDGNGSSTLAVRRGNSYFIKNTDTTGVADQVVVYGNPDDTVLVGAWNGHASSLAVRRGNTYYLKNAIGTGVADTVFSYGERSDAVLVGDWDGDGVDSLGVRR